MTFERAFADVFEAIGPFAEVVFAVSLVGLVMQALLKVFTKVALSDPVHPVRSSGRLTDCQEVRRKPVVVVRPPSVCGYCGRPGPFPGGPCPSCGGNPAGPGG